MGQFYLKSDEETWSVGVPWVKTTTGGWSRVKQAYRKTGPTTWTSFYVADLSAPSAPTITLTNEGARLKITIKAPAQSDTYRIRVKVGKAVSANNTTDSNYFSAPDGEDDAWSEWFITPNATRTKYWPLSGDMTLGTTYYVTAWAEDKSHNYSTAATQSYKYGATTVTPPTASKTYTATVTPVASRVWYQTTCVWGNRPEIRVGNPENRSGFLFFSTRLSSILKGAKSISSMKIKLQRLVNNYEGAVEFHIFTHSMPTYSNIDPYKNKKYVRTSGTWLKMNRGQTATLTIPSTLYADFLSGKAVGLGVISVGGNGNNKTDKYSGDFYGYGTTSGTVYVTYTR